MNGERCAICLSFSRKPICSTGFDANSAPDTANDGIDPRRQKPYLGRFTRSELIGVFGPLWSVGFPCLWRGDKGVDSTHSGHGIFVGEPQALSHCQPFFEFWIGTVHAVFMLTKNKSRRCHARGNDGLVQASHSVFGLTENSWSNLK